MQRGGPAVEADAVGGAAPGREVLLESSHIRPQTEAALIQCSGNDRIQLTADWPELRREVEVGNCFLHSAKHAMEAQVPKQKQNAPKPPIAALPHSMLYKSTGRIDQ